MTLFLDPAYSDEWWSRHDRLDDHCPADEIEAVPSRVRRRYAQPEADAQAACRPLASGVHVQPLHPPKDAPAADEPARAR